MGNKVLIQLRGDKTRVEVAADLGITPQGLGLIERGKRMPRKELLIKFASYYEKSIDELFFQNIDKDK